MTYLLSHSFRYSRWLLATLLVALLGLTLSAQETLTGVSNSTSQFSPGKSFRSETDETAKLRIREGTTITDKSGYFRQDGEGAIFVTDDKYELAALPNLNLERVVRTLKGSDESESIRWSVNGVVTEFNGRNHLLINRAVYKSSVPPPIPEQVVN